MRTVRVRLIGVTTLVVIAGLGPSRIVSAQESERPPGRTEKGLYLLKVVEPGYDVTVAESERGARHSVLEVSGVVPTVTAGGVVLFRAVYDIARERGFEYTFSAPSRQEQPAGASARGSEGRRLAIVVKVFMTNDPKGALKELLGADYSEAAQQLFDRSGYQSVSQLAILFGGKGK